MKVKINSWKYLGSVIGTVTFKKQFVDELITQLISEIEVLSQIAKKELQAGYCCFTTFVKDEVAYLVRRKPNRNEELKRQDDVINSKKFTILHWKQTLWKWWTTFTVSTK